MKVLLLLSVVTLAGVREVFSIHCFDCNSAEDSRCGLPFRPFVQGIVDCDFEVFARNLSIKATMCRKIKQTSKESLEVKKNSKILMKFISSLR